MYLPDDLGNLSRTALEGCDALEELHGKYIMDDGRSFVSNSILHFVLTKGLTVYNSPEGIEWLSSDSFNGDQNLKELNIGEGVKGVMAGFLESYLFASMNLEVLNLPSTISEAERVHLSLRTSGSAGITTLARGSTSGTIVSSCSLQTASTTKEKYVVRSS